MYTTTICKEQYLINKFTQLSFCSSLGFACFGEKEKHPRRITLPSCFSILFDPHQKNTILEYAGGKVNRKVADRINFRPVSYTSPKSTMPPQRERNRSCVHTPTTHTPGLGPPQHANQTERQQQQRRRKKPPLATLTLKDHLPRWSRTGRATGWFVYCSSSG